MGENKEQYKAPDGSFTPGEGYCLERPITVFEEASDSVLWSNVRHFQLCDPNAVRVIEILDELIKREDAKAMFEKSMILTNTGADPLEANRLMTASAKSGYQRAQDSLKRRSELE